MNILLAHNRYVNPGGEDAVFAAESSLLRQSGHRVVEYVAENEDRPGGTGLAVAGRAVWSRASFRELRALLRAHRVDVAHFHNTFYMISPSAYYACREAGVPVVQTLHNFRLVCPAATLYRGGAVCQDCVGKAVAWPGILHACYHGSRAQTAAVAAVHAVHRARGTWRAAISAYIVLTASIRDLFLRGGLPAAKLHVKPNFVAPDPGMRAGEGDYALFVGRLTPEKGLRTLLAAWRMIEGIPLKLVGDGPMQTMVAEAARSVHDLEYLGRLEHAEVIRLLKGARFLVFPSEWYEGFPLILGEAMACGVPVIAADIGAGADLIEDGVAGLHFKPADARDLASRVKWAWGQTGRMREMGAAARQGYLERYTPERNYARLMEIYQAAGGPA